ATSAGEVVDEQPESWDLVGSGPSSQHAVRSAFQLHKDRVSFRIDGHDPLLPLIIDPTLTFGSYSGSTADNFGCSATYDGDGALYGAGTVFGFGYPASLGAFAPAFNGGTMDTGISKWSPDGSNLEWSTYIGGSTGNESPHSLVVNSNNELFALCSTGSSDFPTTAGCFDASFAGGPALGFGVGYGYSHPSGTDIAIVHLSADASILLGSTYVGGTGDDGVNFSPALVWNYGDSFRGEIALDPSEHPVISTCTTGNDLPVTPGAPQPFFGGGLQDAFFFRMNPALNTMEWATYYGGSGDDSGYGVQFDTNGEVFFTGGTASPDLPMAGAPAMGSAAGDVDGFIARYTAIGTTLLSTTYIGTQAYDQTYFVQLDTNDDVFVVGQTHGAYPVTPGKYTNPGSSQFIHKFSHDLGTSLWSTVIGSGQGDEDISPSAFLVSNCGQIYFSGWGGTTNGNAQAGNSTTFGLPVSADAFQSTTNGSDFYLMVLEPEAVALNYATFFGGAFSSEHVDGGTSRFDKNGNVYQAVCAGCGSQDDFPTTPGAWSNTNGSANCNLGVFKFNLNQPIAQIDINGPDYVCLPFAADFNNSSTGGSTYDWDFGDGSGSTDFEPEHTYTDTGLFTITMVLSDADDCTPDDTARITILVVDPLDASIDPVDPICTGGDVQLQAYGGHAFTWFPAEGLSATNIANPIASPGSTTTYSVVVTDSCGTDTAQITIQVVEG
ncbi:MAG: PKD domain-containing protein, partial [Flavobacteriales bacterium]|nr:PKD domain-containing protein [Flavobacteriales bacterium]